MACVAPPCSEHVSLPTVLAVSGEEQRHISKFFLSWRADRLGWQVLIPLRPEPPGDAVYTPYLFEPAGVANIVKLMELLVAAPGGPGSLLPYRAESSKLHLIGSSNGGATVLAAACAAPHLVASLTMVTGFIPETLLNFASLQHVPSIRLYAAGADTHDELALGQVRDCVESVGAKVDFCVVPNAKHGNIGLFVDQTEFWAELERARSRELERALSQQKSTVEAVSNGSFFSLATWSRCWRVRGGGR